MSSYPRVAVLTAFTRGYDLLPPTEGEPGVDFYAFTDTDDAFLPDPWEGRRLPSVSSSPKRNCVYVKTHPFDLLPGYDFYIWMDARLFLTDTVRRFLNSYSPETEDWEIVTFKHPRNVHLRDEVAEILRENLVTPDEMASFEEAIGSDGLALSPMWETNLMLVRPTDGLRRFFRQWWEMFETTPPRDQLAVLPAASLAPVRTTFFEGGMTDASNSKHVIKGQHLCRRDSEPGWRRDAATMSGPARGVSLGWPQPSPFLKLDHPLEVVVPFHNNAATLGRLLESLDRVTGELSVVVVDNGSRADESSKAFEMLKKCQQNVRYLQAAEGLGFGGASNLGISEASGDFVLLLNSDIQMPAFNPEEIVEIARSNNLIGLGFVGNRAGDQSVARELVEQILNDLGTARLDLLTKLHEFCRGWSEGLPVTEVRTIHGSAALINRESFSTLGGFDVEAFPIGYGEEVDLWLRAARHGYRVGFTTSVYYWHDGQGTFGEEARRRLNAEGRSVLRTRYPWFPWKSASNDIQELPVLMSLADDLRRVFDPYLRPSTSNE